MPRPSTTPSPDASRRGLASTYGGRRERVRTSEATRQKDSLHVNEKHSCTRFVFQGGGTHVINHTFIINNTDKIPFLILPCQKSIATCRGGSLTTKTRRKTARHTLDSSISSSLGSRRQRKLRQNRYVGFSHRVHKGDEAEVGRGGEQTPPGSTEGGASCVSLIPTARTAPPQLALLP